MQHDVKIILAPGIPVPAYGKAGDAGFDVVANIREAFTLQPGERHVFPTGIRAAIPAGYAWLVLPRSGLAAKNGLTVLNTPGLIDSGYRAEIGVILANMSREPFTVLPGMRIAQIMMVAHEVVRFVPVEELDETERGLGGFGSTGV